MTSLLCQDISPDEVAGLVSECARVAASGKGDLGAYSVVERLAAHHPGDPGVAVSLLMRHMVLAPGEGLVVPTGTLHSYLRGMVVETMAASDNVLRAGLTPKHCDVPELLACVDYAETGPPRPAISHLGSGRGLVPPFEDFRLADFRLAGRAELNWPGPRIALVLGGGAVIECQGSNRHITPGQAVFLPGSHGPVTMRGLGRVVVAAPGLAPTD